MKKYVFPGQNAISRTSISKIPGKDEQETAINKALISCRKKYLDVCNMDKKVTFKMMHFSKVAKSKPIDDVVDIIRMYLKEDQFDLSQD